MNKRLSHNTLILLVSNGGSAVLSIILTIWIGRYYGESGLGTYNAVLAWIFPLSFVVEFGFSTLITREVARQPDLAPTYLRLTWHYRWLMGGSLILLFTLVTLSTTQQPLYYILSSPLLIILPAYSTYTAIFRAHQNMLPIAFLNIGMLAIQLIFVITASSISLNLTGLFFINTITSGFQLIGAQIIYRRFFYQKQKVQTQYPLADLIKQSRPFAFAGILSALQARIGILWLQTVSTASVVGLFVAALRFADGTRLIPNALFGAFYPALSTLSNKPDLHRQLFKKILTGLTLYAVVVASIFVVFGESIIQLTFGKGFIEAYPALIIMGITLVPFLIRSVWILYWYTRSFEKSVNRTLLIHTLLLITIPSLLWSIGIDDALNLMARAILYTELITLMLILSREVIQWQRGKNLSP